MEEFFKAKAWALLHDPPHKMWAILNLVKYGDERQPPGEDLRSLRNCNNTRGRRSIYGMTSVWPNILAL